MIKNILPFISTITLSSMSVVGNVAASGASWPTSDQSAFYAGLGFAAASVRDADSSLSFFTDTDDKDELTNINLLVGYDFNEYVAVEGRYTTSIASEDVVEMSGWSLFVKPQYSFQDNNFKVYALLGFGGVKVDGINGFHADGDGNGFQWGVGASYSLEELVDEDFSVFFDYTSLARNMDGAFPNGANQVSSDAITLGLTYKFGSL